ncbi:MAG: glycosyltransferase family 2 protein [Muribaculaceae bacterium]|nr:glycosyltransferase family 2 protein [Muribaculaceae bacterium]
MSKPIAVIILNWNGAALLREFLPSVCRNTNSDIADVIIADNGSTDNSLEILKAEFPEVNIIEFDKNYGFAEGYNRAIKACESYKYTVLLNSDVKTGENWLEPLFEYCEQNPDVAACQPKIRSYSEPDKFEYAGAAGGFIDKLGYPYCRGRIFGTVETDNGQYDTSPIDIAWATGAALFVRTDIYLAVGGLDADFFAHMEEIDLCWRIHLAGYRIKAVMHGTVYHLGGGSLPASNPRKTYLNFRNNLLLLHKNLPQKDGKRLLFIRRLYDTLAFFMFVAKLDFKNAKAVLKAHFDFKKMKKNYTVFPEKNLMGIIPGSNCNIIIDYYLKGRKTF